MKPQEWLDWEELAEVDPLWAVLSEPERKGGGWDLESFLATGEKEVEDALARLAQLELPKRGDRALDFGCGVGRCTRALAAHFGAVIGLDVSHTMIEHARLVNAGVVNATFVHGSLDDLEPGSFDVIWSVLVLQHLAPNEVESAIERLIGLLSPGGVAVLGLPTATTWLHRPQLSRRAYRLLRSLGVSARTIHRRTSLTPMRMTVIPPSRVEAAVAGAGGRLVAVVEFGAQDVPTPSSLYVATR